MSRFFRLVASFTLFLSFAAHCIQAQPVYRGKPRRVTDTKKERWADSVYEALTMEERIGQLFMVAAYSGGKKYNEDQITELLSRHQIGGLIFMQGGPARQAILTNKYQQMAQVPLLIGMDAEWGLGMRLDSVKPMPRQMMLGATGNADIVYKMAAAIAAQCNRMGVHINFAPDVDVNNNPSNPVINSRSFGENKVLVSKLGRAYVRGLQQNGVMACAKHFPGHGNTSADSHNELPLITRSLPELDSLELYPFRQMIAEKVKSIMVAHLEVPALESTPHIPTTLSYPAITDLLRNRMHYDGLVITDALNMKGLTTYFEPGDADLRAFAAGNDILLFPQDVPTAIAKIKAAMDSGFITEQMLANSVRKILAAKYDAGLARWRNISLHNLVHDLNKDVDSIRARSARAAITLVRDNNQMLRKLNGTMNLGYFGINASETTPLYEMLEDRFDNIGVYWLPKGSGTEKTQEMLDNMAQYGAAIVVVHNVSFSPNHNYGLGDEAIALLQKAACMRNVLIVLMGNAYATQYFCGAGSVIVGYEDDTLTEQAMGKVLLKKLQPRGVMPVTACADGQSICPAPGNLRVKLKDPSVVLWDVFPAEAGVTDQASLDKLDMFIARCIAQGAFPGCRILATRNGNVFYDKSFGHLDYSKHEKVTDKTLYDVASCTKVLSTTLAVMRLYEQHKLDLDKTIGDYLPEARGTNKAGLKIKDLLLHQAGLKGWIPFYKDITDKSGRILPEYYRSKSQSGYTVQIARDVYMRDDYIDTMWAKIYDSRLDNRGRMVYSDLDYYFLAEIVKAISSKTIDRYAEDEFYKPMGLKHILYRPLRRIDSSLIAPTEIDLNFRQSVLRGYVHDPGAAMLGGIGGHAGLFATAHDVAVIFQMLLNKGVYGNKTYFNAATVDRFTAYGSKISHRGLGFDKPLADADNGGPTGDRWSALSFGHQGFTGTCVWADPASGVVFVFLSNRVYPSGSNTKINKLSVRTVAQDYIYEALGIPVNKSRPDMFRVQTSQADN